MKFRFLLEAGTVQSYPAELASLTANELSSEFFVFVSPRPFFAGRGGSGTNLDASRSPNLVSFLFVF